MVALVAGRDIPVIAAGGIVDHRGYIACLALGAQGVSMGTRLIIHQVYLISLIIINTMKTSLIS